MKFLKGVGWMLVPVVLYLTGIGLLVQLTGNDAWAWRISEHAPIVAAASIAFFFIGWSRPVK